MQGLHGRGGEGCEGGESLAEWLRGYCGVFPLGFYFKKTYKRICRATSGQVGSNSYPEHGLVKDGTPCGDNLICLNQTCVSLFPHVDQTKCPTNKQGQECSEHGVSFLSGAKQQRQLLQHSVSVCVCVYTYIPCICTYIHTNVDVPVFAHTNLPLSLSFFSLFHSSAPTPTDASATWAGAARTAARW